MRSSNRAARSDGSRPNSRPRSTCTIWRSSAKTSPPPRSRVACSPGRAPARTGAHPILPLVSKPSRPPGTWATRTCAQPIKSSATACRSAPLAALAEGGKNSAPGWPSPASPPRAKNPWSASWAATVPARPRWAEASSRNAAERPDFSPASTSTVSPISTSCSSSSSVPCSSRTARNSTRPSRLSPTSAPPSAFG